MTLQEVGVTTLLDVRELPVSRRKGFSKSVLAEALSTVGIAYQHERRLGSPRDVRNRLRETGDMGSFLLEFEEHLSRQTDLLDDLAATLSDSVVLLCYERDVTHCHRQVVAREIGQRAGCQPQHLRVRKDHGDSQRAGLHSG
ncbi:DUF488 domain-containing protein [Imhoffiella purpurea]|uniref:DUF488 domain-containing protein n=1 Tax=Imhoffiella purpurea TaxID=1249627 RepID=UPI0009DFE8CA